MSSKAVFEADGKRLLEKHLEGTCYVSSKVVRISEKDNLDDVEKSHSWLLESVSTFIFHVLFGETN